MRLVTITVGANDLGLTGLAAACTPDPNAPACVQAIAEAATGLPQLTQDLAATYAAVAAAAPKATIVVTGYAPLVSSGPIYEATRALNLAIQSAVAAVAAGGADIIHVDVAFTGHTLDSGDPWFFISGPNAFHPTPEGERAYADAIAAAIA